jgi:hypothetical protein
MTVIAMDTLMAVEKELNLAPAETVGLMVRGQVPDKLEGTPEKVLNERIAKAVASATNNAREYHSNTDELVGGSKPAEAPPAPAAPRPEPINAWLSPFKFLAARKEYNESVDADEQLSWGEFKAYMDDGVLPAHVAPKEVLATKMARAEKTLGQLKHNADETRYMSWGLFGAVTQFQQVFYDLNDFKAEISDAQSYARERGLPAPDVRPLARQAVRAARWHVDAPFRIRGFIEGGFSNAYREACRNYRDLAST